MGDAPQQMSVEQFAKSVRDRYPGAYDKMNDSDLTNAIVAKYPKYKDKISGLTAQAPSTKELQKTKSQQELQTQSSKDFVEKDPLYQKLQQFQQWSPRWDKPNEILQDPHWYGRSARYLGGEFIGAGKTGAGVVTGGWKMLNDVATALNPFEKDVTPGSRVKQVGKDVTGVISGIGSVGKASWDLIRHFPQAAQDPEGFGNTITNAAMIVDGSIKGAKSVAEGLKVSPEEAVRVASKASSGPPSRFFKRKAFEDAYVHSKGFEIAKKISNASKEIDKEIRTHAGNLAEQIDTKVPSGVIDAAAESQVIAKEFQDVVKAPEKAHPVLAQMVKDAKTTAPGQWSWEKTRQFRSSIGRAMSKTVGPQKAVLTRVYRDLTNKLGATAKKYGLEDSWNQYNELERKTTHQFGDKIDDIREAQSGREVTQHLSKDPALTSELARNLSKYGLDQAEVLKFVKDSTRIIKQQGKWQGTLFRMAYGSPAGVPVMLAMRMAGAPWIGSVGAGALAGYGFTHIVNLVRALKLSPDVIEHILSERELPGRMPVSKGNFPTEGLLGLPETTGAPPSDTPPVPGAPSAPSEAANLANTLRQTSTETPRYGPGIARKETSRLKAPDTTQKLSQGASESLGAELDELKRRLASQPGTSRRSDIERRIAQNREMLAQTGERRVGLERRVEVKKTSPETVGREPGAKPGTTRVSKLGRATKARERVAKQRSEAKRTRESEIADAQARAQAQDLDVSKLQIPEMEEALRSMKPDALSGLQKMRKAKTVSDAEYQEALKFYILEAYEKSQGN